MGKQKINFTSPCDRKVSRTRYTSGVGDLKSNLRICVFIAALFSICMWSLILEALPESTLLQINYSVICQVVLP